MEYFHLSLHFLSFESFRQTMTVSGGVSQSSFVGASPWLWPVAHANHVNRAVRTVKNTHVIIVDPLRHAQ